MYNDRSSTVFGELECTENCDFYVPRLSTRSNSQLWLAYWGALQSATRGVLTRKLMSEVEQDVQQVELGELGGTGGDIGAPQGQGVASRITGDPVCATGDGGARGPITPTGDCPPSPARSATPPRPPER